MQVAEGALGEVHSILQRMRELTVQGANDTNTKEDRDAIQRELVQLEDECDRIFKTTEFNTQKIWDVSYIPTVTGVPRELKLYNDGFDADGNPTFGGIAWGENRYTWNQISTGMYNSSTGKFNPGNYSIKLPVVQTDVTIDDYNPLGGNITLDISVSEEGELTSISRKCEWAAEADGIRMDGVLYKWEVLEDASHQKSFNKNNIEAGTWGFNTYNGAHVWFNIPEEAENIDDVIKSINGNSLDDLEWKTQVGSIKQDYAVGIIYGKNASTLAAPTINITNANKDSVGHEYTLHADDTGVWVTNERGENLGKESWTDLGFTETNGQFIPNHDYTNHTYYSSASEPDDHADETGGAMHYTSDDKGYNSTKVPGLDIQFMVMEEASKQAVINGINGTDATNKVKIDAAISTPSKAAHTAGTTSGKVTAKGATSVSLNFELHKELGRDFDNINFNDPAAVFGTGTIAESNGTMSLNVVGTNGATKTFALTGKTYSDVETQIKNLLQNGGGNLDLNFKDGAGNSVSLRYGINGLTTTEENEITLGTLSMDTIVADVLNDIKTTGGVTFSADGRATQKLGHNRTETNALGWANSEGNVASYADFYTEIRYIRGLDIQAGALQGHGIKLTYEAMNAGMLGLGNVDVSSYQQASGSLVVLDRAIEIVSEQRSLFGAYQNRLEHADLLVNNTAENTTAAESRIRDADMAEEMLEYSTHNILEQAGQSILAQANQSAQGILMLLQ